MFKHTSFQAPQPLRFREHHRSITLEATEQVQIYKTILEFKNKPVKAYAMVFAGFECTYCGQWT